MTPGGDKMAEYTCESCGQVMKVGAFSNSPCCPNCGTVMLKTREYQRKLAGKKYKEEARQRRVAAARKWGIEPVEWKALSVDYAPSLGASVIQNALDSMSDKGWEFVSFRVPNPQFTGTSLIMVFKRKIIEDAKE